MDHDYPERLKTAHAASMRMGERARASNCQHGYSEYQGRIGVTVRNDRPRMRGLKRRQRLMVRRILITRLERMAAKGIVPDTMPIIP